VGTLFQALLTGVMSQWLIDPYTAPSAHDLFGAHRAIIDGFGPDLLTG
jgi:hypothetical protein